MSLPQHSSSVSGEASNNGLPVIPCQMPPSTVNNISNTFKAFSLSFGSTKQANNNCAILEEEDKVVVPGLYIRAGTADGLAEFVVQAFPADGQFEEAENHFPRVTFLMHQWFDTSEGLAKRLVALFWRSEKMFNCPAFCRHTRDAMSKCEVYQYRSRVCYAFRYWICNFPIHFDLNATLTSILNSFQHTLREKGLAELADRVDISKIPSYQWTRNVSVRNPSITHTRKESLVMDLLEPHELADHLTFLEHKVMSRITFTDFKAYANTETPLNNPKLERSICLFNGMTQWIQCMVLRSKSPQQRAEIIEKFVQVSRRLLETNNFNTLMAVVGGLSHSALARLTQTNAYVSSESKKCLSDWNELLSSNCNFSNYRKLLSESKGFRIPVLAVHMKDLISLNVALPDTIENGMINFRKVAHLSAIFKELWELQNSSPNIVVSTDLVNTLKLSLDKTYSEDEIYEMSLTREPRVNCSPNSLTSKPTMFGEWVSDMNASVDDDVLERHLHSVIEVIFNRYDQNRDGFITFKDFQHIAINFTFIDSFSEIDMDQDGRISKAEMKQYFLQSNCQALKLGFRHNFHETTYFKPTFCGHCTGLLWGIIKQGYKCKECGVNTHKHCKELMVMECSRSASQSARSHSFSSDVTNPFDSSTIRSRFRNLRKPNRNNQPESDSRRKLSLETAMGFGGDEEATSATATATSTTSELADYSTPKLSETKSQNVKATLQLETS